MMTTRGSSPVTRPASATRSVGLAGLLAVAAVAAVAALAAAAALTIGGCNADPQGAPGARGEPAADRSGHAAMAQAAATPTPERATAPEHDIALARRSGREQLFEWVEWSPEAFARARDEGRPILLHCAAVWCHWCHVMEETTYRDPEIGRILRDRFVTIRVDIDSRPDIEERYAAYGWPATVVFSPDAQELGKHRGYLEPGELRDILLAVEQRAGAGTAATARLDDLEPGALSAPIAALAWVAARVTRDMDAYYDHEGGSWGSKYKSPLGDNVSFELRRAARGNDAARRRAVFTLRQIARIIDPVWGGVYQYSTHGDWDHAHFEKLMTVQASNLEAYARAHQLTGDPAMPAHAAAIARYVQEFLTSPQGTFYVTQDADVGAHDETGRFVDGNDYYHLDDAGRRALGVPWVDEHVYAYENGLMIAALVALHEATGDADYLARARTAADAIVASHVLADGAVVHDATAASAADPDGVRYLADAAGLGRGLARLAIATKDARYAAAARRIAERMVASLQDREVGAFWSHTPDPAAAGVFTNRRHAFPHNVLAARFLAALADAAGDDMWRRRAITTLAAIATPAAIDDQGRWLGGYLLAVDEAGAYPW